MAFTVIIGGDTTIAIISNSLPHLATISEDQENAIATCINPSNVVWISFSYVYKVILQLVAVFMTFQARKFNINSVNDAKEVALMVYINSFILVFQVIVDIVPFHNKEVYAALYSLALTAGATFFLSLTFIPKVVDLEYNNYSIIYMHGYNINNIIMNKL